MYRFGSSIHILINSFCLYFLILDEIFSIQVFSATLRKQIDEENED